MSVLRELDMVSSDRTETETSTTDRFIVGIETYRIQTYPSCISEQTV